MPLFSGFAPAAIAARLKDAQAKLVFTTDWAWRRGSKAPMKRLLDDAVDECPSVQTVVVLERDGYDGRSRRAIDVSWEDFAPAIGWRSADPARLR